MIKHALLPSFETSIEEDDAYYKSAENTDPVQAALELFEIKNFVAQKLIELIQLCNDEENMLKIISLLEKVKN